MIPATEAVTERRLGRHGRLSEREAAEFRDAERLFPGGALGGNALPNDVRFVVSHGKGARFWDTSGNEYIDYVLGSGPLVLGHAHHELAEVLPAQ